MGGQLSMDNFVLFMVIGFFAQMIDGSLGMGYKVSSTTFLLTSGVPPLLASASVHVAGVFTSAVTALAHYQFKNFDAAMIKRLALPGLIGGMIGALLLAHLPTGIIKPFVSIYLFLMGVRIILKALNLWQQPQINLNLRTLGLTGGFFDAIGGGGWGPIVTGTLVGTGHNPHQTIGSVNIAEFFVTLVQAATFVTLKGEALPLTVIGGLLAGGVLAAPLAAWLCKRLPVQRLVLLVGLLIIALSSRALILAMTGG